MAVRRTIEAIKNRRNHAQVHEETPSVRQEPKKQIENDFAPEATTDAKTFSRDLKNLEQLNSKFHKPLEAER